ncbi:MAG: glycosyltransferase [Cyclobacteriaceae bacterium]
MSNDKLQPNIALILPGGIGTGKKNIGVPILERIIKLMTVDCKITVFQLYKSNEDYAAENFELIDIYSPNRIMKIVKFLFVFRKVQRYRKFKAVHGFWAFPCGFLAVLVGKVFGMKSLISLQGGDAISLPEIKYGQLQKWLPRKMVLWALHHAGELISPTNYLVNNLQKFGLKRNDIKFIPLGVDPLLFKFLNKPIGNPVQFLHIANLHPVKGQVTLLNAFKIISDRISCHLTIIGEGILEKKIKSLAEELKINHKIIFHDPFPYETLPAFYHQADILLHTSLSEGQAMVVLEAMSCGVLVCGTRVGLLYDLQECCISVPVGDYESLATETLELISAPKRMNAIRQRAYNWATEHPIEWSVEKIKESYTH